MNNRLKGLIIILGTVVIGLLFGGLQVISPDVFWFAWAAFILVLVGFYIFVWILIIRDKRLKQPHEDE